MDETRFMLLILFSKNGSLERMSGMKGVVRLLLDYTSLDAKWAQLEAKLYMFVRSGRIFVEPGSNLRHRFPASVFEVRNRSHLDHFLQRIKSYPNVSLVEKKTALTLLKFIAHGYEMQFQKENEYFTTLLPRLFDAFKRAPFQGHPVTQEVFRRQAAFGGYRIRFAKKEVAQMFDFRALDAEGIEFTSIREDFMQCTAVLRTSRGERVTVEVQLPDDYPFISPSFRFVGAARPKVFSAFETICMEEHFEWAMNTLDGSLRSILFEMETQGVV